jgi:3-oxoacyl-[acyl-carrier protein] reductase
MNHDDLKGRVALVTGASRNIGRAIAVALAERGADIVVHVARDEAAGAETVAAVEALGRRAALLAGDLSQPETAMRVVSDGIAALGRLDIVVNNAAIRPEASFGDISFAEWRQVMGVTLDAVFLVSQAALPHLEASDHAAIVNLGGLTGHTGASNRAHVITAKGGVVSLTKAMAHELSPKGITVNCVAPGLIETQRVANAGAAPQHHDTRKTLVGRRGTPEDVAEAVAYLAGRSGRYVTGQTLHVNGGTYLS